MDVTQHIAVVEQEGKLFADSARQSGLDAEVPDCPGWKVRDLVRHLGMIHLWAAGHVAFPHEEPDYQSEEEEHADFARYWPELGVFWVDDDELIDWYLQTNANLVRSLKDASPDLEAWTFLPAPSPREMWARRQAHEIAVHRYDAEHAGNAETGFDPMLADDGIDELLAAFAPRGSTFPVDAPMTMLVRAADTGTAWHVTMAPDGISTFKGIGPTDVTLTGTASDLYLAVWNRGDDSTIEIEGDSKVLDTWHETYRIRWS
mgnify:CR=1 FL=1